MTIDRALIFQVFDFKNNIIAPAVKIMFPIQAEAKGSITPLNPRDCPNFIKA